MPTRIQSVLKCFSKNEAAVMLPFQEKQETLRKHRVKRMREYVKKRRSDDLAFKLVGRLRTRLTAALKAQKAPRVIIPKESVTVRMLGCSVSYLMEYLSTFFAPGMSWANHGEWEIDHVKPCRAFDLTNPEEQMKCFHYTNLFPVWKGINRRKSDKWKGLSARSADLQHMTIIV